MALINLFLWLAASLVVILGPIILIHELGHYVFAKLAGVRVEEFGFGLPPRILKLWRGAGTLEVAGRRFTLPIRLKRPPGLRQGAFVVLEARLGRGDAYRVQDLEVRYHASEQDLSAEVQESDGVIHAQGWVTEYEEGTIYSLTLLPLRAFVKMTGEEDPSDPRGLTAQPLRWRAAVIGAGIVLNIVAAVLLLGAAEAAGRPQEFWPAIVAVSPDSPAEAVGLQAGDVILSAEGVDLSSETPTGDLIDLTNDHLGQEMTLTIRREGREQTLRVTPRVDPPPNQGAIGIQLEVAPNLATLRRLPPLQALGAGVRLIGEVVRTVVTFPARAATGNTQPGEGRPGSIVIILEILALQLKHSIDWRFLYPVLQQAGLVSLAIGITNLLPLPGLDGGRLLFMAIEAIPGIDVSPEREAFIHMAGLLLLTVIMLGIIVYDIINPLIPWDVLQELLR